jgi:hypothetical protein
MPREGSRALPAADERLAARAIPRTRLMIIEGSSRMGARRPPPPMVRADCIYIGRARRPPSEAGQHQTVACPQQRHSGTSRRNALR